MKFNHFKITSISRRAIFYACIISTWFIIVLSGCTPIDSDDPQSMLNNQNRASEIIEAIEAYHADHKQYPESLHELTTYNYISEIPRTEAGATFEYKVYPLGDPVDKYILLFYTGTNSSCAFAPYIDRWDCGYFDH